MPKEVGTLHCCICNALTSRVIGKKPVCTKHFIEGWGRLPQMPLPKTEEERLEQGPLEEAPLYVSQRKKK